jgi:hypothetical protein
MGSLRGGSGHYLGAHQTDIFASNHCINFYSFVTVGLQRAYYNIGLSILPSRYSERLKRKLGLLPTAVLFEHALLELFVAFQIGNFHFILPNRRLFQPPQTSLVLRPRDDYHGIRVLCNQLPVHTLHRHR